MLPVGSMINAGAIIAGGLAGLIIGGKLPSNIRTIVFQGIGLAVLVIGLDMALKFERPLITIFSLIIGGIIGESIHLDDFLNSLGDRLKKRLKSKNELFTDGFVSASLLFCVGSMAIVGALDEGLRGDPTILMTKSVLDGFVSVALASTYGVGVLFSAAAVFAYQYGISLFASNFSEILSETLVNELTALGGLLIIGIGLNLLDIKNIKISNLLPSLLVLVVLVEIFL
ncbi:MAG: DUF554 domain-containing protein [Pseudomonadota bacterium]